MLRDVYRKRRVIRGLRLAKQKINSGLIPVDQKRRPGMAQNAYSSEFKDIIREAEEQGWVLDRTSKGHVKMIPPDRGPPVFTSGTPGDYRAIKNFLGKLRRRGFIYRK